MNLYCSSTNKKQALQLIGIKAVIELILFSDILN